MSAVDTILTEVNQRLAAVDQAVSEQRLLQMFKDFLGDLTDDDPIVRKMRFGARESVLVGSKYSRWGLSISDIEYLHDFMQARQRAGLGPGPSEELTRTYKSVSDAYYISEDEVKRIDRRAIDDLFPRVRKGEVNAITQMERYQRAMDTAETGFGLEIIGAQYVRDLWEAARAESRVFNLIDTFEMTDATAYLPVEVDIPEPLFVGESTANNSSNYATVKTGSNRVTVSAKKLLWHQMWSRELEEDAIIPFVPFLRRQMMLALAHYSDAIILNGDTTNAGTGNINLDDADPADTKYYLAFDGIRHGAIVDNTANHVTTGGAITLNQLRDLRGLMIDRTNLVDWGHPTNMEDLVFVTDPETGDRIALLDDVIKAKQMNGSNAMLLAGEVGRIVGHPVITSMAVSKTEADGKVSTTGSNNTLGQVVAFNRRGFKVGWRRRIRVEMEALPATDQSRIVYSARLGFGRFTPTGAASGIEAVAVQSNISL
jgi:hypothetical protein